jgi:hypothetical protein
MCKPYLKTIHPRDNDLIINEEVFKLPSPLNHTFTITNNFSVSPSFLLRTKQHIFKKLYATNQGQDAVRYFDRAYG